MAGINAADNYVPIARATVAADAPKYDTLEQAIQAAIQASLENTQKTKNEYGGMVLQCSGQYVYTSPVTSQNPHHVDYKLGIPKGCTPAGLYHMHPSDPGYSHLYSPNDIDTANNMNLPSFIHEIGTTDIKRLDPGSSNKKGLPGQVVPGITVNYGPPVPLSTQLANLSK